MAVSKTFCKLFSDRVGSLLSWLAIASILVLRLEVLFSEGLPRQAFDQGCRVQCLEILDC